MEVSWYRNSTNRENIAYKKPSLQSSTSIIYQIPLVASYGNDGYPTWDWERCSVTELNYSPWWQVDLTRQAAVTFVRIKNAAAWDPERINPFDVSVGDDSSNGGQNNALCVKDGILDRGELKKFDCPQILMGRYVSIFLNRQEYLQVCELEVYEVNIRSKEVVARQILNPRKLVKVHTSLVI
eukprot:gene5468-biopygen455